MRSLKTQLLDRNLRFDGISEVEPDQLARLLLLGVPPSKLRVTEETEDVAKFNAQVGENDQIKLITNESVALDFSWQLPEKYQQLDLEQYFADRYLEVEYLYPAIDEQLVALDRISVELTEISARGMEQFMRTIIYILDELKSHDVVWGVGRGSSCASYLLFIAGLHVVDCVKMDVSMDEFFHD